MTRLRFHTDHQLLPLEVAEKEGRLEFFWEGARMPVEVASGTEGVVLVLYDGRPLEAQVRISDGQIEVAVDGRRYVLDYTTGARGSPRPTAEAGKAGLTEIRAPMPGKVVKLLCSSGDAVEAGQGVLLFEAMKMQNEIRSPVSGEVAELAVSEGQAVESGELLFCIFR